MIPKDISAEKLFKTQEIIIRDSLIPIKDKKKLHQLRTLLVGCDESEDNKLKDLSVEFQDYFGSLPLINIPVVPSPLYIALHLGSCPPVEDSFEILSFYRKAIALMLVNDETVRSRKKSLILMLVDTIGSKSYDTVVSLLEKYAVLKEGYDIKPHLEELKQKMMQQDDAIKDSLMFFYSTISLNIASVKRIDPFNEVTDIYKPKYSEDVLLLKDNMLMEWNTLFFKGWDDYQKYLETAEAGTIPPDIHSKLFYTYTWDLLYCYEIVICHLLAVAKYMHIDESKALLTQSLKPPNSEFMHPPVLKKIVNTRIKLHKYKSTLGKYEFSETDYEFEPKYFVNEKDIESLKSFYKLEINSDNDLKDLIERRVVANKVLENSTPMLE
jgi:hypothetical protein